MSMQRVLVALVLGAMAIGVQAVAYAEGGHWVSIGSYSDSLGAQRARDGAAGQLTTAVSIREAVTDTGIFYRIVTGPFATRAEADAAAADATAVGYQPWVYVDNSDTASVSSSYSTDSSYASDSTSALSDDYSYDSYALPDYDSESVPELDELDGPDGSSRVDKDRPFVDKAPEGYRLHKLRRDSAARPPPHRNENSAHSRPESPELPELPQSPAPDSLSFDLNTGPPVTLKRRSHDSLTMKIDGRLDESIWRTIEPITDFHAIEPDTLVPASLRTELRLFYTERGLYVSYDMEQDPETFVQWITSRDRGNLNRDHVGITLDTSGEGLYGYFMAVALGGNLWDGTVLPERRFSSDWDGAWYGDTAITEDGWSAELFIPWSQVAMPRSDGHRRMALYASRKYSHEDVRWGVPSLVSSQSRFMSAMRPLELTDVDPRQQWSVIPYASVTQDEVESDLGYKAGAEVFWRPSTNFQLSATLNPDFGNVESDDVDVNLTAFETFFRDKRLFFLEGREIFETTPRSNPFTNREPTSVVNTRRIGGRPRPPANVPDGLTVPGRELGQPTELQAAVKATGQMGRLRYGLLAAAEDDVKFDVGPLNLPQDGSDYGVARFLYEDSSGGGYRAIGTISTLAAHPEQDAIVHGVDAHYLSRDGRWKVDGQLLYSDKDDVGTGSGGFVDVVYTARRGLSYTFGLDHYDERLDISDLGFLRRNDATNARAMMKYSTTGIDFARKVTLDSFAQFEVNGDGLHTRRGIGTAFDVLMNDLSTISGRISYFPERDEDRESFGNGAYIVEGRHDTIFEYESNTARRFSYKIGFEHDGEPSGEDSVKGSVGFVWRPLDRMSLDATAEYWRRGGWLLHRGHGVFATFDTNEWRPQVALEYNFTARQQLRLIAQWVGIKARAQEFFQVPARLDKLDPLDRPPTRADDFSISNLNVQIRYRWEIAPLSDLFVVYTLGGFRASERNPFGDLFEDSVDNPDVEQLVVKLRYRLGS